MTEILNKETLKKLYEKGKRSLHDIAKTLGLSYCSVRYRSKKYGLNLRPKKRIDLNKLVFKRLFVKEGKTTREIAKTIGCSFETVRVRCKEVGIPLRKPGSKILDINELPYPLPIELSVL